MDHFTAFSLASSVLSFVTFAGTLVKDGMKIHESGGLEENATLESNLLEESDKVAADLLALLGKMKGPTGGGLRARAEMEKIVLLAKQHDDKLGDLMENVDELKSLYSRLKPLSEDTIRGIQSILDVIDRACADRVLSALKYDTMMERSTWVRDDPFAIQRDVDYGNAINWIFERGRKQLTRWSVERGSRLKMVNFSFSMLTGGLQERFDGLYRTLLYQLLSDDPELISKVLKGPWGRASSTKRDVNITMEEKVQALTDIFGGNASADVSLCIFMDGLDELKEVQVGDMMDLVNQLSAWAAPTERGVKICSQTGWIGPS
ncbi:hypothetical protein B0T26DRAFT_670818 [Lasiosphaeria miniovina]|uniref:Nephrocystin 3-like N-terminal domain-containing protein n=1 Tax=Lasiosphaeria miniovina TaxID=1954250 RepID=A0AA40BHW8_9PEZI|nr:uncharacterized protein B0T26DRAFT_670818 [Lasiosphaeria miniovina]KAK0734531.1 hypothetical protein B0T26DRAFT_670818 [Lasiosphaeria miniovina]